MRRRLIAIFLVAVITLMGGFAATKTFASTAHRHTAASHGQLGPGASILSAMPGVRHAVSQYTMPRLSGLASLPHPVTLSSLAGRGTQQRTGTGRSVSPKAVIDCGAGGLGSSYSATTGGPVSQTCITPAGPGAPPQVAPLPGIVGVSVTVTTDPGVIVVLTPAAAPCAGVPATGGTPNPLAAPGPGTDGFVVTSLGNPHGSFTITPPPGYVILQYNPKTGTCIPVTQITGDGVYQIQPAP